MEGKDFTDRQEFGKSRKKYLANFLELPNGIPDSDTFKRVFEKLNPSKLSSCLVNSAVPELLDSIDVEDSIVTLKILFSAENTEK